MKYEIKIRNRYSGTHYSRFLEHSLRYVRKDNSGATATNIRSGWSITELYELIVNNIFTDSENERIYVCKHNVPEKIINKMKAQVMIDEI